MVNVPSTKKKPRVARSSGVTAQIKKDLMCVLGCCKHENNCVYWKKVVDSDDPAKTQYDLILKMFGGKK